MSVSTDAPHLDIALQIDGICRKRTNETLGSEEHQPGRKQVFRQCRDRAAVGDLIARRDETHDGTLLLEQVMRRGERLEASELGLPALRDRAARMIGAMPPALRALAKPGRSLSRHGVRSLAGGDARPQSPLEPPIGV